MTAAFPAVVSSHGYSPVSAPSLASTNGETTRVPRAFMDEEYPEWTGENPPWRNPDPRGPSYLFVWQQHGSRISGHH